MNGVKYTKGITLATIGTLVLVPDALLTRLIATDPPTLLLWRGLLMSVTVFTFLIVFQKIKFSCIKKNFSFFLLSGILLSGASCCFVISIVSTKVANTLFILSTTPIIAALFTRIFYGKQISGFTWTIMIFCVFGISMMTAKDIETMTLLGNLAALGSACFHAGNFTLLQKAKNTDAVLAVALSGCIVAMVSLPFAAPFSIPRSDAIYTGILGIIVLPVSFGLLTYAPQFISSVDVSLIMLLETILSPILVWIVLDEALTVYELVGGVIVLSSILIYMLYKRFLELNQSNKKHKYFP